MGAHSRVLAPGPLKVLIGAILVYCFTKILYIFNEFKHVDGKFNENNKTKM